MFKFIGNLGRKYIKPWFFSSDDPKRVKAPYVISFVFLSLTVWAIVLHLTMKLWQFKRIKELWSSNGIEALGDIKQIAKIDISLVPLITVLIGTAGMFIGLYNWGKDKPQKGNSEVEENNSGDGAISPDEI